jgi:probable rRNA maturation factor
MRLNNVAVLIDVEQAFQESVDEELLDQAVHEAIEAAGSPPVCSVELERQLRNGEVSVRITDDTEMRQLNMQYRGLNSSTDVLSFSFLEEGGPGIVFAEDTPRPLGEIVVSLPYAQRQSKKLGHSLQHELAWLTIHGTLQLLGYTHEKQEDTARMEALEQDALCALGFQTG